MATHSQVFKNISATTAAFNLPANIYNVFASATWGGGNIQLQKLGPDGSTYIGVHTAITANGASGPIYLPAGTYKVAVTTATAVYVAVDSVLA